MSEKEKNQNEKQRRPKANKPKRETDHIEKNDLPYDPNINQEDRQALHEEGLSMDQGRDRPLSERDRPVDFTGKDLDIPGQAESDTTHAGTDLPDEENNQYNERGVRKDEDKKKDHPNPDREIPPTK